MRISSKLVGTLLMVMALAGAMHAADDRVLLGLSTAGADVAPQARVQLRLERPLSTKSARVGDPVYLRTASAIVADGVTIPIDSEARGVVARAERPGRVRGRGELQIRVVSITRPDGTILPVNASGPAIEGARRRRPRPGPYMSRPAPPMIPILAGMVAGYGTSALVSPASDSAEAIVKSGMVAGLATGVLVGVLKRGDDLVLYPGLTFEVVF